jgi:hypothetical protein
MPAMIEYETLSWHSLLPTPTLEILLTGRE